MLSVIWNTACERHWKAGPSAAAASPPQTLTETEERAILWRLCRNLKIKWQRENGKKKRSTASSEGKHGGEFKRGALVCVLILFFFSRKGQFFSLLFCHDFALRGWKRGFGFYREEWNLRRTVEVFFRFIHLLLFFPPLLNSGNDFWTGVTYWNLGIPAKWDKVKYGNLLLYQEKKYQWPWTVLIFPNQIWRGERKNAEERHLPPLHLLELRRLLGIWNQPRQQTF